MKKEERLHRLFGDIDDDLVADAAHRVVPLKVWLPRVTAAVAAVALVVGLAVAQPWATTQPPVQSGSTTTAADGNNEVNGNVPVEPGTHITTTPDQPQNSGATTTVPGNNLICTGGQTLPTGGTPTTTVTNSGEIWYEPKWDEKPIWRQFPAFERFEKGTYTVREITVDATKVGEYLQDVTLHGYDIYTDTGYDIVGKIYRIKGINPDYAVALQYPNRSDFFPATCGKYSPATLGEFINDLNLRKNMTVGTVYSTYPDEQGYYRSIRYEGLTAEAVWEMLLKNADAANEYNNEKVIEGDGAMSISVNVPLLGIYNLSLRVTVDGYLFTNLMDTGKVFYTGEEATDAFMDYVRTHCRAVSETPPLTDTTTTTGNGNGTTTSTPAQPPLVTGTTVYKPAD